MGITLPQFGQRLSLVPVAAVEPAVFPPIGGRTISQMISPIKPVKMTMMSHNAPLLPRFSASRYTQIAMTIAMMNHISGSMQNAPSPNNAHPAAASSSQILLRSI